MVILGAGLTGLSILFHTTENSKTIYEKSSEPFGHINSKVIDGFRWDEGPHVSFTEHEYVRQLFEKSVDNNLLEFPVKAINYFYGSWIYHPAQTNLFQIDKLLRERIISDLIEIRKQSIRPEDIVNYKDWLIYAFGNTFYTEFPLKYTLKYWTTDPENLTINWIGKRVYFPEVNEVLQSQHGQLSNETHYIKFIRYPKEGGYKEFARLMFDNSKIKFQHELYKIDFNDRKLFFLNGKVVEYDKLISTIPLPDLIAKSNAPEDVKSAALKLNCSSLLLVNVVAKHSAVRTENWIYVYDHDKYSTRINCTELLSPNNGVPGKTGIQVEVYFSKYREKVESDETIAKKVITELVEMGLILDDCMVESYHTKFVKWANVIFDLDYRENLDIVLNYLAQNGLVREYDDLEPMTNWSEKFDTVQHFGEIILAGRFGQWKYYWTDDCVLRGKFIADNINHEDYTGVNSCA